MISIQHPRWAGIISNTRLIAANVFPIERRLYRVKKLAPTLVFMLIIWPLAAMSGDASSMEELWQDTLSMVREKFPRVRHISTQEFANLLAEESNLVVLDTRDSEEYLTSHIKGAVLTEDIGDALKVLKNQDRNALIAVYCSVGYRSSNIANKLARRGYSNVVNVEGSLFKWANEGRPIFQGDLATGKVHPYDDEWGRLLDRTYWP